MGEANRKVCTVSNNKKQMQIWFQMGVVRE